MIFIVSNGQSYSAHRLYFVEAPEAFRMEDYLAAVRIRRMGILGYEGRAFSVVGTTREIAWRRLEDWSHVSGEPGQSPLRSSAVQVMSLRNFQRQYDVEGEIAVTDCLDLTAFC